MILNLSQAVRILVTFKAVRLQKGARNETSIDLMVGYITGKVGFMKSFQ